MWASSSEGRGRSKAHAHSLIHLLHLSITCKIVNIYCRCGSPGQSLSPAERSRILILIICMYVCMYVCIYVCIEREREREREQVRTVFVPVHRIQELIQVADISIIKILTTNFIKMDA